jgi:muramoyltetrapeptide carboxypeptidase
MAYWVCVLAEYATAREISLKNLDIEVVAPSSGCPADVQRKIAAIIGKKYHKLATIRGSTDQIAADLDSKFSEFDKAVRSSHCILWTLRGGYGADKLMKKISATDYSSTPKKIIVGYSDATALLIYFSQKYGWKTIYGTNLVEVALKTKTRDTYSTILRFLVGETKTLEISDLSPLNRHASAAIKITGKTTGGNLTCMISSIGTAWQIETSGKILFLEDVHISGFRLDRLFTHVDNAGLLKGVKAIILGQFENEATAVLQNFAKNTTIPVYKSESFGHFSKSLPFGYNMTGKITKDGNLFKITMK